MPRRVTPFLIALLLVLFQLQLTLPAAPAAPATGGPLIRLQTTTFDPLAEEPQIPTTFQAMDASEVGDETLYLLQFTGPVQEQWKQTVSAAGAQLHAYVPDYAFVARIEPDRLDAIGALPFVRWVGPYRPAYRLAAAVAGPSTDPASGESGDLSVYTLPDSDPDRLARQVATWDGTVVGQATNRLGGYLRVRLPAGRIADLAQRPEVLWVEPYHPPELLNDTGGGRIMRASELRASMDLFGAGQIVAIADSGLDTGNLDKIHPDLAGRVRRGLCLARPDPCDWSDPDGHGTHVAGSVLGNGLVSGSNPDGHAYDGSYAGVAPEAELIFQSIADDQGELGGPQDIGDLMRSAYRGGARIHSNSWGGLTGGTPQYPEYGGYTVDSQQVDLAAWEQQDLLILYAAGNAGEDADSDGVIDTDSIAQPGTAKNTITVGASENDRPSIPDTWGNLTEQFLDDRKADNPDGMAAFSSRGPTDDGRIKPDVVAPGTLVASLRNRQYFDDMESGTDDYEELEMNGGTAGWELLDDDAHSGDHYWRQEITDTDKAGAATLLLTPEMDLKPTGPKFDLTFWHKYALDEGNWLALLLLAPRRDTGEKGGVWLFLNPTGSASSYTQVHLSLSAFNLLVEAGLDPRQVQIGFAILSEDGDFDSWWAIDDLRVVGADRSMSSAGLAQPGDPIDVAYSLKNGTSMATPLTAGAAALVREWLVDRQGIANPSSALMKAVLLNGAAGMTPGQYGEGSTREIPAERPNVVTGWGRVDLVASLNPAPPRRPWTAEERDGLATGESATFELEVGGEQSQATTAATREAAGPRRPPREAMAPAGHGLVMASAAPAAASSEDQDLIQNGGFEQDEAWSLANTIYSSAQAHAGVRSMALPAGDVSSAYFYQTVTFPEDLQEATLYFYWLNEDPDGYDWLQAWLYNEDLSEPYAYGPVHRSLSTGWERAQLDFESWLIEEVRGRTVNVLFYAERDSEAPHATFYVDEVSLATRATTPTPTAEPTPSPGATATPSPTIAPTPTPDATPTPKAPPEEGSDSLRITLVWTDYPGQPQASRALVNDLDLEVIAPDGQRYRGNQRLYPAGHQCTGWGGEDRCNNVEGVRIPDAAPGQYTVRVTGYNVPQGPQPFAVAATGNGLRGSASQAQPSTIFIPVVSR